MVGTKRKISEVEDVETQSIPSVKNLASSESRLRRQALLEVLSHFKGRSPWSPLTPVQCQQLWRGFHVAVYMHDSKNALSVQNLIATLADTFTMMRWKDQEVEGSKSEQAVDNKDDNSSKNLAHSSSVKGHKNSTSSNNDNDGREDEFNGFDNDDDNDDDNNNNSNDGEKVDVEGNGIDESWLSTYTTAFWATIIREWATIDSHRMNKYLLLIRLVTRTLFAICTQSDTVTNPATNEGGRTSKNGSNSKSNKTAPPSTLSLSSGGNKSASKSKSNTRNPVRSQMNLLTKLPLNTRDTKIPNGLRIHMLDIYVDELERVITNTSSTTSPAAAAAASSSPPPSAAANAEMAQKADILALLKRPLQRIAKDGIDRTIRLKAREEVEQFEKRIEHLV